MGQTYAYCTDTGINAKYDPASYISSYYNTGSTNFDKVFASPSDMLGLQQLMDKYLEKYSIAVNTVGDHKYVPHTDKAYDGALAAAGLSAAKCVYCGNTTVAEVGTKGNNSMYISADTVAAAGYTTVKEYMLAGLGNVFYKTSTGWGRCGYSSIQGMAAACDGVRSSKAHTDGSELYWKIKSLTAAYDANGNTVTEGESYISLIGYDMTNAVTAKGIGIFFGKNNAPTTFKVLGGVTGTDGAITWKELAAFDNTVDSYHKYDDSTVAYLADIDSTGIDCLQIAVQSSTVGTLYISEIELY